MIIEALNNFGQLDYNDFIKFIIIITIIFIVLSSLMYVLNKKIINEVSNVFDMAIFATIITGMIVLHLSIIYFAIIAFNVLNGMA